MSRRSKVLLLCGIVAVTLALILYSAFSHSGRTDSRGGHHNRKTGTYHYHGSSRAKSSTIRKPIAPLPAPPALPVSPPLSVRERENIKLLRQDIHLLRKDIALLRKELKQTKTP